MANQKWYKVNVGLFQLSLGIVTSSGPTMVTPGISLTASFAPPTSATNGDANPTSNTDTQMSTNVTSTATVRGVSGTSSGTLILITKQSHWTTLSNGSITQVPESSNTVSPVSDVHTLSSHKSFGSSPVSYQSQSSFKGGSKHPNVATMVSGVICGVFFLLFTVFLIWWAQRRKIRRETKLRSKGKESDIFRDAVDVDGQRVATATRRTGVRKRSPNQLFEGSPQPQSSPSLNDLRSSISTPESSAFRQVLGSFEAQRPQTNQESGGEPGQPVSNPLLGVIIRGNDVNSTGIGTSGVSGFNNII